MKNISINMYKDGDDLIVVFKNTSEELVDVIKKMLAIQAPPTPILDLEAPPEAPAEIDLSEAECLTPIEKISSFNEFAGVLTDAKRFPVHETTRNALLEYYNTHNKILADKISTLETPRVKGFVSCFYGLNDEVTAAFNASQQSTIKEFVDFMPEGELRRVAHEIGDWIVSFFKAVT